jgi:hypothetical protein
MLDWGGAVEVPHVAFAEAGKLVQLKPPAYAEPSGPHDFSAQV